MRDAPVDWSTRQARWLRSLDMATGPVHTPELPTTARSVARTDPARVKKRSKCIGLEFNEIHWKPQVLH